MAPESRWVGNCCCRLPCSFEKPRFPLPPGPLRRTFFLREAEAAGWDTLEGWEMLLRQGVRQFRIWTGREPDEEAMRAALRERLS